MNDDDLVLGSKPEEDGPVEIPPEIEAKMKRRFAKPIVVVCLQPTGIATGPAPPGAPPGAMQMAVRDTEVRCENLGQWYDFAQRVMKRELIPMPPLQFQLVELLAEFLGED